jgi:hypothetical protein
LRFYQRAELLRTTRGASGSRMLSDLCGQM